MKIAEYLAAHSMSQAKFAELVSTPERKITQGLVWQWMNDRKPVSAEAAVQVEQRTEGGVGRKDLRPDDWVKVWPELAEKADA